MVTDTTNNINKLTAKYWQPVYRAGNILTLWMVEPYTGTVFDNTGTTNVYSQAPIHTFLDDAYITLDSTFYLDAKNLVATPADLSVPWQTDTEKQSDTTAVSTSGKSYAANNLMDNGLENDKLWLPSHAEVFNNTMSSWILSYSDLNIRNGLWQTNFRDRFFGRYYGGEYVFLRSTNTYSDISVTLVGDEGAPFSGVVTSWFFVRPALHLNLESVYAAIPTITATVDTTEDGGARMSVNGGSNASSYVGGIRSIPMQIDFTASPGYTINSVTLNGTALDLSATTAAGVEYMAEYSKDKRTLTLTLTSILQDCNIVAKSGTTPCVIEVYNYPIAGGTVTGAGSYTYGAEVTLTAVAAAGYRFDAWFCDGVYVSDTTYTFTARKDIVIMAMFHKLGNYHINDSP